jgi:hypothetical protein
MRIVATLFASPVLMVAMACAPMPTVALDATPADLEVLAGEWHGEYSSAALGRRGAIEFKLEAGTNEAYGDVLMVPQGIRYSYQREPVNNPKDRPATTPTEVLTIRFVRAEHGSVTGMLDRYWDPDRNCYANTTFRGYIGLGVVEGTFKTTFECGTGEATGEWRVVKKVGQHTSQRR